MTWLLKSLWQCLVQCKASILHYKKEFLLNQYFQKIYWGYLIRALEDINQPTHMMHRCHHRLLPTAALEFNRLWYPLTRAGVCTNHNNPFAGAYTKALVFIGCRVDNESNAACQCYLCDLEYEKWQILRRKNNVFVEAMEINIFQRYSCRTWQRF